MAIILFTLFVGILTGIGICLTTINFITIKENRFM